MGFSIYDETKLINNLIIIHASNDISMCSIIYLFPFYDFLYRLQGNYYNSHVFWIFNSALL